MGLPFDSAQGTNSVCRWLSEVEATLLKCFRSKFHNTFIFNDLEAIPLADCISISLPPEAILSLQ